MRILLCNWRDVRHPARGGAEVYTHEVLRRWARDGHEVTLVTAAVPGEPGRAVIDGVEHVRGGGRLGVYAAARRWWRAEGRHRGYDLIIDEVNTRPFECHRWEPSADGRRVPVVALAFQLARDVWFAELPLPLAAAGRYLLEPRWLRSMRYVPTLTISESSRRSLVDAGVQRVSLVPIGVGDDGTSGGVGGTKETDPTAVFVGRLAANKRPEHAVVAAELARRALPGLRLWLVGDGPRRRRLEGRSPGTVLFGRVDERRKQELVARAHVLVVTSVREGWGLVVDEAARLGTPTIGYDVPGLRDSVRAAGGTIVEPRPEAMAEALVDLLPGLVARGRTAPGAGWSGGAVSWDECADAVLARATLIAGLGAPMELHETVIDLRPADDAVIELDRPTLQEHP